jgi:predicted ATP-grasp superfamily ATP-dependent carboligase
MVGVLPGLAKERGISGVVLLAETLGHPSHLGITGAQEIIKILDIVLKLKIDIKELDKEVKEIEKELKEKVEKLLPLEETKKVKEKKAVNLPKNPHEISYIG